ncbi:MAG: cadherin-like beta sandwich domain-containing protein, partial [Prevotellaceae bacterium]|nr:cadherin-like beta sandwich domain-containing protein [Prevotellaceae bacterium]
MRHYLSTSSPFFGFGFTMAVIAFFSFSPLFARKTLNINNEKSLDALMQQAPAMSFTGSGEGRSRPFDANPALSNLTSENTGDTLKLDFFEDKRYTAVVSRVARSYDGITGITARILNSENAYCFISASAGGVSVSADIPQSDEQFFAARRDGASVLRSVKMSRLMEAARPCAEFVPGVNDGHDAHAHDDDDDGDDDEEEEHRHPAAPSVPAAPSTDDPAVIDVLVLYTDQARQWCLQDTLVSGIDDLIDQAMQKANLVFSNSNTGVTVRVVHKYQTGYRAVDSNADIMRLQGKNDGYMDDVHEKRKQYKADIVMLIAKVSVYGGQGTLLSSEGGQIENGFSYCRVQQLSWTYTAPHEIGHNLGCHHHRMQPGGTRGLYTYSNGWRGMAQNKKVSTVMTYEQFDSQGYFPHIPFFSDPQASYLGTSIGNASEANNTLTIKKSKHIVAAYSDYLNPALATLSVTPGKLAPDFDPEVKDYTVTVASGTKSVNISAAGSHSGITVIGAGNKTLSLPEHTFTVTLRGAENSTVAYTVKVIRDADEPSLKSLSVSGAALSPAFSPAVLLYSASVPADVATVEISAEADGNGTVSGAGTKSLKAGENTFEIIVTGNNGANKIYMLKIARSESGNADLSYLTAGNYALSPLFSPEISNYSVAVAHVNENVVIAAAAAHPGAAVEGTGFKPLDVGDNTFRIKVTAENGTVKVYTLIVTRTEVVKPSGDATLKSLTTDADNMNPAFSPAFTHYALSTSAERITVSAKAN